MRHLLVHVLLTGCLFAPLAAQEPAVARPPRADSIPQEANVPRNAFLRAMALPGWGHIYIGAPKRGAVFMALQGPSYYMLVKTIRKLNRAKDRAGILRATGRDSLDALIATDTMQARLLGTPAAYDAALAAYPGLEGALNLVVSRQRHRQDWIVYTIFFTFAGAVDAYVAAHLRDFPADVTLTPEQAGGFRLELRIPTGSRR